MKIFLKKNIELLFIYFKAFIFITFLQIIIDKIFNFVLYIIYINILLDLIIILLLFIFYIIFFIPKSNIVKLKRLTLIFSLLIFVITLFIWIFYNNNYNFISDFSFVLYLSWVQVFNINYIIGVDGISIFFILLTTFLIPICILASWTSVTEKVKEFMVLLLITELLLINLFIVLDLFFFYVFFESVLIPMYIIIGVWGSRQRKIHASYQFFFFTLLGSILMLVGILIIYFETGTTDIQILMHTKFNYDRQLLLWLAFFASFAVKIPMVPVHIWLPEAHVEAPTAGSVILAGVLLKLGAYGVIRILLPFFPDAMIYYSPLVYVICIIGIIYSALTTITQIDLKKIIAYSSVAHMNFAILGLFANNIQGITGSLFFMLAHGIVSSALFLCVGMLYERYHTRNILYYGGLVQIMPIFSIFLFIFVLANIGLPGTVNFIGEFLVLIGVWKINSTVGFLSCLGMILGAIYNIWFYNRLVFGRIRFYALQNFVDLTRREFFLLLPLFFLTFFMGIYPLPFLECLNTSVIIYIQDYDNIILDLK